ncbi:putative surface protein with fasciclin (FAS1) repeats [Breznakibacter xylanolyticus]|uniref:Putative surface protein with fasciclin (FAS1) repeats n=1 Tax=Breznakibacter xylanolyticus TaxID=990 RepID=A0A2W7NZG9_9BACT|nr:fasciclin domain-containing protein [Breznakibacter xylanolyticus]PZX18626.1 putative surface protein with fasciclin (FAS1) repeats [Breznakibacter xylanolyticus]
MNKNPFVVLLAALLMLAGCSDAWDDHVAVSGSVSKLTLSEYILSNSECSQFAALLTATGLDRKLDSVNVYTVWLPTNSAMANVDPQIIDTDEEKKAFVLNHLIAGKFQANVTTSADSLRMLSGKKLWYQPAASLIDEVTLLKEKETVTTNGVIQYVAQSLSPRLSIWEWVLNAAPSSRFITYLKSLDYLYFDAAASGYLGTSADGKNVYRDSVFVLRNKYLQQVADLSSEDSMMTLLVPSDELFEAHFNRFQKYYRLDDRESNVVPTARDSAYIWLMVARDFAVKGDHSALQAPALLTSVAGVQVPFNPSEVSVSYKASNGHVHMIKACDLAVADKILPIVIDANQQTLYRTTSKVGMPTLYYRQRANALNGYDMILDNQSNSKTDVIDGLVIRGGMTASCRYRVKIRAVNDFGKSYRYADNALALSQMIGPVTVIRYPKNDYAFEDISDVTNKLTDDSPDVDYSTSYYVAFPYKAASYSPLANVLDDELDLGSYYYRNAEMSFFRLVPLSAQMAVTLDYIRLIPILED